MTGRPRTRPDTPTVRRHRAASLRLARQRQDRIPHITAWLHVYKMLRGCQECGYGTSASALHFHHRDPTTKRFILNATQIYTRAWASVEAEIAKCDVVCANCHAEHHERDRLALGGHSVDGPATADPDEGA